MVIHPPTKEQPKRLPSKRELAYQRLIESRQPSVMQALIELMDCELERLMDDFDVGDGSHDIIRGKRLALKELKATLKKIIGGE
jgi:hypothetical protein